MNAQSVIFYDWEIQALQEGCKSSFRRIISPQPKCNQRVIEGLAHVTFGMDPSKDGSLWYIGDCIGPGVEIECPYGTIGQHLWAQEDYAYAKGGGVIYKADERKPGTRMESIAECKPGHFHWLPAHSMPWVASRFTLEITNVSVQRVLSVSNEQAIQEGVTLAPRGWIGNQRNVYLGRFMRLNNQTSLDPNHWLWVIEFKEAKP